MSKEVKQGGDLMLFAGGKSIAMATNHTLKINAETKETSSKDVAGGAWATSEVGKLSWEATTENLYAVTPKGKSYDDLFGLMIAKEPIDLVFGPQAGTTDASTGGYSAATTGVYKGKGIITSLELNAPNGDNATYSATFTGVSALVKA